MRKFLALAPALLLVGCHSAQVVMQPQPFAAEPIADAIPAAPFDSILTATVTAQRPAAATGPSNSAAPVATAQAQLARQPRQGQRLHPFSRLATAAIAKPLAKRLAHRLQRPRPTEGAAESGLGGIAFFAIAVVLAVLAGLAALVSLIPGVSFWGGLGLAAAGLLVIFLLYSLFSGGKKKK